MKNPSYAATLLHAVQHWARLSTGHDVGDELNAVANAAGRMANSEDLPRIVCLCGSTRFYEAFQETNFQETMAGNIVLSVGFYPHGDASKTEHGEALGITAEQKHGLDRLHKRKIDLADEVLVLNVGGYVGSSTRSEVLHAAATGKPVRWLEPGMVPDDLRGCGGTPVPDYDLGGGIGGRVRTYADPTFDDRAPSDVPQTPDCEDRRTDDEVADQLLARFEGHDKNPPKTLPIGTPVLVAATEIEQGGHSPFGSVRATFTIEGEPACGHSEHSRKGQTAHCIELEGANLMVRAGSAAIYPLDGLGDRELKLLRKNLGPSSTEGMISSLLAAVDALFGRSGSARLR